MSDISFPLNKTKTVSDLTEAEKAYFAGLFDGEGCVLINKKVSNKNKTFSHILCVSFNLTHKPVLYEMKNIFGGDVYIRNMDKLKKEPSIIKARDAGTMNPENLKQLYIYKLYGRDAWIFLKVIYPYCKEKKEQVRVAIEFHNNKKDKRGIGLSKFDIERGESYYKKLQELKNNITSNEDDITESNCQTDFDSFCEE